MSQECVRIYITRNKDLCIYIEQKISQGFTVQSSLNINDGHHYDLKKKNCNNVLKGTPKLNGEPLRK